MTSRMLSWPSNIMQSRSMPIPIPPAGGMPCSRAIRNLHQLLVFAARLCSGAAAQSDRFVLCRQARSLTVDATLEDFNGRWVFRDSFAGHQFLRQMRHESRYWMMLARSVFRRWRRRLPKSSYSALNPLRSSVKAKVPGDGPCGADQTVAPLLPYQIFILRGARVVEADDFVGKSSLITAL
jgi:hypothetical protein